MRERLWQPCTEQRVLAVPTAYPLPTKLSSSCLLREQSSEGPMEDLDDSLEGEEALQSGTELTSTHECI